MVAAIVLAMTVAAVLTVAVAAVAVLAVPVFTVTVLTVTVLAVVVVVFGVVAAAAAGAHWFTVPCSSGRYRNWMGCWVAAGEAPCHCSGGAGVKVPPSAPSGATTGSG